MALKLLVGLLLIVIIPGLNGCKTPKEEPPPPPRPSRLPVPPQVRDVTLGRAETMRVGDAVSIILDAVGGQIPIDWAMSKLPRSWERTTGSEGRFYQLTGRIPMGASDSGIDVSVSVIDGNQRRSQKLPLHINVVPKVYDFQPTLLSTSEDDLVREYSLRLRNLPDLDPMFEGRLEIWVDTVGLNPGDDAQTGDSLRLWDESVSGMDMTQTIQGDSSSASSLSEPGETFQLRSQVQIEALDDTELRLTIRSLTNPRFRVVRVQVTLY